MIQYFMSDKKLNKLRERQRHLRSVINEYAVHDFPYPSVAGWPAEALRLFEIAIRLRCQMEADVRTDVIERIESRRCHQVFERAVHHNSIPGPLTNDPRLRAVEILRSVAPEQRDEAIGGEDAAALRRLVYLLQVAELAASAGV